MRATIHDLRLTQPLVVLLTMCIVTLLYGQIGAQSTPSSKATDQALVFLDYQVEGRIGLSYTFGSIYNNVVNTQL